MNTVVGQVPWSNDHGNYRAAVLGPAWPLNSLSPLASVAFGAQKSLDDSTGKFYYMF